MSRPGPKPKQEHIKEIEGTKQKCRTVVPLVPKVEGSVYCPLWIRKKAALRKIWDRKVETYIKRGQPIIGCEEALTMYVVAIFQMEEVLKTAELPSIQFVNAYRQMCNEFLDTPAAQYGKMATKGPKDNPFATNKKPIATRKA